MEAKANPNGWLDEMEAAPLLRISFKTLQTWRYAKPPRGPKFFRIGRRVFYRRQDIEEYIRQQTVTTRYSRG